MAPMRSPGSTPGGRSGAVRYDSPVRRFSSPRRRRTFDDASLCAIDPDSHKEKLPRPLMDLTAEAIYNGEANDKCSSPTSPASPSRTPKSDIHEKGALRQFLWTTTDSVFLRPPELAASVSVPLAAICAPFVDGADSTVLPLSDTGSEEPLRCTRCRSYVNPYWKFAYRDSGKIQCNMCGHNVEIPEVFLEDMERSGQNTDVDNRPELAYGSVDFTAPASYDLDRPAEPCAPATCFLIETSASAVTSGFAAAALQSIERLLDAPDDLPMQRRVCLVSFDEAVNFFTVTRSGRFCRVAMKDADDPYLPVSPQSVLLDLGSEDARDALRGLLQSLRQSLPEEVARRDPAAECVAGGSALRASVEALTRAGGGDVLVFQAGMPDLGIGSLRSAKQMTEKERGTLQQPAFYEEALALCTRGGVAVSMITAPAPGVELDVATLQWLPWRTGGDTLHFPAFSSVCVPELEENVRHWTSRMQGSAYGCVMKLRCSKGLNCQSLIAPWPASSSSSDNSAFEVPRISADTAVAFVLRPEIEPESEEESFYGRREDRRKNLFIQVAVLYTNASGQRLLRLHTSALSVVNSVRALYQSVSLAPLMTLLLKQAVVVALERKPGVKSMPKDCLLEFCLEVAATCHRHCQNSEASVDSLVITRRLALLPLYILAGRKLLYSVLNGPRDRSGCDEMLRRLLRMPIHSMMVALYPRVYPLPAAVHEGVDLPVPCPTLQEQVTTGPSPAYLITNGFGAWFYEVDRGDGSPQKTPNIDLRENAKALCQRLRNALEPSAVWMPLGDLPGLPCTKSAGVDVPWQDKVFLSTIFVEDEGVTEMAYGDWIRSLQAQVLRLVD
mmetsp:Transcript_32671/g.93687  ORF Transcript_32671/g.93687 Transcript_32671/m.93687 type:complete len:840 (-) Transcript_32671:178-2697(-)